MEFIRPKTEYFEEYLAACRESNSSIDHDIKEWMPVEADDFAGWKRRALSTYEMLESGDGLPEGIPRMITYWCVEGEKFIGEVQIRPYMTQEDAKTVGHIGYAVRYSMWNKGFGTQLLQYAIDKLREHGVSPIYIACHVDNIGSNRISRKLGFEFIETRDAGEQKENLYILRKTAALS